MNLRLKLDLAFPETVTLVDLQEVKDFLMPFYQNAIVINEGEDNEERGFIVLEKCRHENGLPCEAIAKWEVGRGKVI